ncbi:MAG: hypothetical protein ACLP50_27200 [Solirubrobacteraceae bacterium]
MHHQLTRSQRPTRLLAAAVLAAATTIAGCSSSSPNTASSAATSTKSVASNGSDLTSSPLAFSRCMRANGVPNFPDLRGNGIRIQSATGQTISVNGVSVNAPAFLTARQTCERYMPHAQASQAQSAHQTQQGLQFARCMRSHGVPNFPDPKVVSTSPGGNQQVYLPGVNPQSPAFQTAAKACGAGPKGP